MKIAAMTGVAMLTGMAPQAAATKVTVCMEAGGFYVQLQAARARDLAAKMYADIGVMIDWRPGLRGCPPSGILIKVSDYSPPSLRPTSLAYALPFEGTHIVLFYDRIQRYEREVVPILMAHVLVHEIAHILQGLKRHSDQGIMKRPVGHGGFRAYGSEAPLVYG
jgi:hypothetical protein